MRERPRVEEMAKLTVEGSPAIVAHLQQAIFDAKSVVEILAEIVAGKLDLPAGEIAPVEQLQPFLRVRVGDRRWRATRRCCTASGRAERDNSAANRTPKPGECWHAHDP